MTRQQIERESDNISRITRSTRSTRFTRPSNIESTQTIDDARSTRSTRRSTRPPQPAPIENKNKNKKKSKWDKRRVMNLVFSLILFIGIGSLAYGGYMYYKTKALEQKSILEVQDLLGNRGEIEPKEDDPLGIRAMLEEKQKFMNSGFGHGDGIGMLYIPKLDGELPIVEGVNPDDLMKGVGHYQGTAFPTDNSQIVLSGHRDTVFRGMGNLEIGDTMTISMPYGDFEYKVVEMFITDPTDRSVIVPDDYDYEHLTVTTCYPFNFIGNAPQRYIVQAEPMFDSDLFKEKEAEYMAQLNQE